MASGVGRKDSITICSIVSIEGQEYLNIGLGTFLMSKDSTDCMGARNSSGLPLKTGTCHIFKFDNVVLHILQRKDLINGVICGHNAVDGPAKS